MEEETKTYQDDVLELYVISSDIMRNGTPEERAKEKPIYEMLQKAVAEIYKEDNINYQKEKAKNSLSKQDILNYSIKIFGVAVPAVFAYLGYKESKKQFYTTLFYNMEYGNIQGNQAVKVIEEVKRNYKENLNSVKNLVSKI